MYCIAWSNFTILCTSCLISEIWKMFVIVISPVVSHMSRHFNPCWRAATRGFSASMCLEILLGVFKLLESVPHEYFIFLCFTKQDRPTLIPCLSSSTPTSRKFKIFQRKSKDEPNTFHRTRLAFSCIKLLSYSQTFIQVCRENPSFARNSIDNCWIRFC